jgi:hypothetical protein
MHVEVTIDREALMRIIDELDLDQMSNSPYKKQMSGSAENLSKLNLNLDQINLGDTLGRDHSRFFVWVGCEITLHLLKIISFIPYYFIVKIINNLKDWKILIFKVINCKLQLFIFWNFCIRGYVVSKLVHAQLAQKIWTLSMAIGGVINPVVETYNQYMQEDSIEISINSDFTIKAKLYISKVLKNDVFALAH